MNINRNNYEKYFLLYVDNELPAAEKNMVERFAAENPDLQEELLMLQQTILRPESMVFSGKETLLRSQPVDEQLQQRLLLLLDAELPVDEQKALLEELHANDALAAEWAILQQVKLTQEKISFDGKASLYRQEEKERRVVPLRWWQMAAAAMILGFGIWGAVSYLNQKPGAVDPATAIAVRPVTPVENTKGENAGTKPVTETPPASKIITDATLANTATPRTVPAKIKPVVPALKEPAALQVNENAVLTRQQLNSMAIRKTDLQNINRLPGNITQPEGVSPVTTNSTGNIVDPETGSNSIQNEYAINTASDDSDNSNFDENDNEHQQRSRLGGFLKKVKRTLERKMKIKNGSNEDVKIANMSFAMH